MRTLINLHLVRICVQHADISLVLRKNHAFSFKLFKRNSTKNQNEITTHHHRHIHLVRSHCQPFTLPVKTQQEPTCHQNQVQDTPQINNQQPKPKSNKILLGADNPLIPQTSKRKDTRPLLGSSNPCSYRTRRRSCRRFPNSYQRRTTSGSNRPYSSQSRIRSRLNSRSSPRHTKSSCRNRRNPFICKSKAQKKKILSHVIKRLQNCIQIADIFVNSYQPKNPKLTKMKNYRDKFLKEKNLLSKQLGLYN